MTGGQSVRDAVIVGAVRTPIGKRNGALSGIHPVDLSAIVLRGLVDRAGVDPQLVDDVVWGCVGQLGEQGSNIGRLAVLAAGWPHTIPGTTVDRACGSSQQAAHFAAAGVVAGQYDLVIAGGVESMSRIPLGAARRLGPGMPYGPMLRERFSEQLDEGREFSQGIAAEIIATKWKLNRRELDEYSVRSHEAAGSASDQGRFSAEIVPIGITSQGGSSITVTEDEGIRRSCNLENMAGLRPSFKPDGVVTPGNASQISDGASALLIANSTRAAELGLRPLARFHSYAVVGCDPVTMLAGPIPATAKVLARAGLSIDDVGVFEVNEAFASVTCAWMKDVEAKPERVNPNGGSIALGHPLGASGTRLMATMVHHMRSAGIRYGLQAMCEGGGMANATILESVEP